VSKSYLIVGLGNPGKQYVKTRHNIGFEILDDLASKHDLKLQEKRKLNGLIAITEIEQNMVVLLKPTTYMNLSGKAVKGCVNYYKIDVEGVFVIVDDIDTPLGELRLKPFGGAGTHNGLKSIEYELNSKSYARLKIGIGTDKIINLEEFVLKKFLPSETQVIKNVKQKALDTIEILFKEGMEKAMNFANTRIKKQLGES